MADRVANPEMAAAWDGPDGDHWTTHSDHYEQATMRHWGRFVEAVPIPATWGEATACGRRIAPSVAHDGFYYATLRKTGNDRA